MEEVTTLPPASSMASEGAEGKVVPDTMLVGSVVKATWAGAPTATVKAELVAGVRVPSVAWSL